MSETTATLPLVSVIIPARNCETDLRRCLESLKQTEYPRYEIIVVDDASTDNTTGWIDRSQVKVVLMPEQSGPAAVRNFGASIASGEYLLFLDADVLVQPQTIALVVETFQSRPDVSAVFGSYDQEPKALNIISQYRNLMHHYVHQEGCEEASTFWSGCGAIRCSVFHELGGFDPNYRRPCIEDIELGVRMRKAGYRIQLNKKIQVTHMKRWTLWNMLKADIRDRGLPWSQLLLREKSLPNDLNLSYSHRISALLACGLFAAYVLIGLYVNIMLIVPIVVLLGIAILDSWSLNRRVPTTVRILAVLAVLAGIVWLAYQMHFMLLLPLALFAGILVLNWRFYVFLARTRKPLFIGLAVPLHILYYLYSLGCFSFALLFHWSGLAMASIRHLSGSEKAKETIPATGQSSCTILQQHNNT